MRNYSITCTILCSIGVLFVLTEPPKAQSQGGTIIGGKTTIGGKIGGGPQVFRPGDTIKISVTFEGPDAGNISAAQANLTVPEIQKGQEGFKGEMFPGNCTPAGPNTFMVSFPIPENQASGEYKLEQLRATTAIKGTPITLIYYSVEFPAKTYRIENPNHIVKPKITDVK